jgi:hypothetical protein
MRLVRLSRLATRSLKFSRLSEISPRDPVRKPPTPCRIPLTPKMTELQANLATVLLPEGASGVAWHE